MQESARFRREAEAMTRKVIQARRGARLGAFKGRGGLTQLFRAQRASGSPPLAFLSYSGGTACTPPALDKAMAEVWDEIYRGNGEATAVAARFIATYRRWIPEAPEVPCEALRTPQVLAACRAAGGSAPGADCWAPAELKHLPVVGAAMLTAMFNAIESGAPWPSAILVGKGIMLSKLDTPSLDPAKYRCLLVASCIYRLYAKLRLRTLRGWQAGWQTSHLHAGVPGKGAEDAWLQTAILNEADRVASIPTACTGIEMYKCFDQANRPL
eukprot:15457261-Alexandrium_andersonii.AAC.1